MKKIGVIASSDDDQLVPTELFFKEETEHLSHNGILKGEVVLENYYGKHPSVKVGKNFYYLTFTEEEHNGDFLYSYILKEVFK